MLRHAGKCYICAPAVLYGCTVLDGGAQCSHTVQETAGRLELLDGQGPDRMKQNNVVCLSRTTNPMRSCCSPLKE